MRKARPNRSSKSVPSLQMDGDVSLTPDQLERGASRFKNWHWGVEPIRVRDMNDPDYPEMLIECGRLIRLHLRLPNAAKKNDAHPRRARDHMIEFSKAVSDRCHIAFDPDHRYERLYLIVDDGARQVIKRRFWDENPLEELPLGEIAALVGGHHGTRDDYPDLSVKPIGILTAVVYFTTKEGDGRSYYIHKMGEVSHHYPVLCVDEQGRLWLAGSSYRSPDPGITD